METQSFEIWTDGIKTRTNVRKLEPRDLQIEIEVDDNLKGDRKETGYDGIGTGNLK